MPHRFWDSAPACYQAFDSAAWEGNQMNLPAGLLLALAFQPAPTPPAKLASMSALRATDCVRLKAEPLAATPRSAASIAYEAVRACEPALDELTSRAKAAAGPERDVLISLRLELIELMIGVAEETVRQQRAN